MSERAQLRSQQVIRTFGPGAMVDLPRRSVVIAGLKGWRHRNSKACEILEPRLSGKVAKLLKREAIALLAPPPAEDLRFAKGQIQPSIIGYEFPHWFVVQNSRKGPDGYMRRRLVHREQLDRGDFQDPDSKKRQSVVAVRFVRGCKKGHLGDLDWRTFVHRGGPACLLQLWLEERGTTGDLSENLVVCECGAKRNLSDAADRNDTVLGMCNGSRPWLDDREPKCGEPNWLLLRNASNAYFAQVLSVISIPDSVAAVDALVQQHWENCFKFVKTADRLAEEREKPLYRDLLKPFTDEVVLAAIGRLRSATHASAVERPVKDIEFEALTGQKPETKTDDPDGDFFARDLSAEIWRKPWLEDKIEKVVLVHRLREVSAIVGFTRFESAGTDIAGELDIDVERAALDDNLTWVPAVENRGEGIFLQVSAKAIGKWFSLPAVQARATELEAGFQAWKVDHPGSGMPNPGVAYTMLHSLAHMLMTAISLECGYPASSLRERIYAPLGDEMAKCFGILVYTASSDAQGTLGGLVNAGREIERHLARAAHLGLLCSNDPVCSGHQPGQGSVEQLSGSACHGCLYVSETSCEQQNRFLDRSLVVPTLDQMGCEFLHPPMA